MFNVAARITLLVFPGIVLGELNSQGITNEELAKEISALKQLVLEYHG